MAAVQGTELINIKFYTKYFNFIDEVPVYCWKKRIRADRSDGNYNSFTVIE